jgi:hypothetical protein
MINSSLNYSKRRRNIALSQPYQSGNNGGEMAAINSWYKITDAMVSFGRNPQNDHHVDGIKIVNLPINIQQCKN